MKEISIIVKGQSIRAQLNDSQTAQNIWESLPFEGSVTRWGDELYFPIPLSMERESGTARTDLVVGELGFWPLYNAFCLFFGPTPLSSDQNPKAYGAVNVFGKMSGDLSILSTFSDEEVVRVERG